MVNKAREEKKYPFKLDSGDESNTLANKRGQFIEFYSVPTGQSIQFKAFLTQYSDQYNSDWNEEDVFGRMDAITTFKGTKRVISLGFDVIAGGIDEAIQNLQRCSNLVSLLYPTYEVQDKVSLINAGPLFKLKFMNLIQDVQRVGGSAKESGLLGKISGLTYEPNIEHGFFDPIGAVGTSNRAAGQQQSERGQSAAVPVEAGLVERKNLYPQMINLSFEFTVLHQHALGWRKGEDPRDPSFTRFPYANNFGKRRIPTRPETPIQNNDNITVKQRKTNSTSKKLLGR